MTLELNPATVTILDVPPHNAFVLTCSVTTPVAVVSEKAIRWQVTKSEEVANLRNSSSIWITVDALGNGTSISTLTVMEKEAGQHEYLCKAQLEIEEDISQVVAYNFTAVTVKGKMEKVVAILCVTESLAIA